MTVAPQSNIYADSGYTDYTIEDDAKDAESPQLMIQRKSNNKREDEPWIQFLKEHIRKGIEPTFSMLKGLIF